MVALLRRWLAVSVPLVIGVSVLTFLLVNLIPGDAARSIAGVNATPEQYAALRTQLGLDQPLWKQYADWAWSALHGDFGRSTLNGSSVARQLGDRFEVTVSIVVGSLVLATIIGVLLGMASAVGGRVAGTTTDVISLVGLAVPAYWLGLLLAYVFAVRYQLLPATGFVPISDGWRPWLQSIALPVITLGITSSAGIAKQTRDAVSAGYRSEYVSMLRARGIGERNILFVHVLRNAGAPIVTMIGLVFLGLLSGTVLVETVFVLPGLGSLAVTATRSHDIPVIQMVTVVFAVLIALVNLVIEIVYTWLDPRVRA